jgi:hypothetical protein
MGEGSPGSREAEGEGGEGFYIAQSGRHADLRVSEGGAELGERRCALPVPFCRLTFNQSIRYQSDNQMFRATSSSDIAMSMWLGTGD